MAPRTLTITLQSDWRAALRAAGHAAQADQYQGETLNFETPAAFFGRLTERSECGGVACPFEDIHVDLRLRRAA